MKTMEDMIARELAMAIAPYIDSYKSEFDEVVELDNGMAVFVNGTCYTTTSYEEETNYCYTVDVSVDIDDIEVHDTEGEKIDMKFNQRAIENFMAQYIAE